jgi:hypothetical protein
MELINKINEIFKTPLGKQSLNYFLFYIIIWIIHLILISFITYFHLILNHNIGTIADWIVDRGWIVISLTKIFIFSLATQFMKLRTKKFVLIKGMLRNAISIPRTESFVVLLFLILGIVALGDIKINPSYFLDFWRSFSSVIGTFIFFAVDLFFLLFLDIFNPLKTDEEHFNKIIIFPFLFYIFTKMTFIYEQMVSFKLYGYFLLILYIAYWRRRNWTLPILFISVFFVPLFTFLGLDPVWGNSFSLFKGNNEIGTMPINVLLIFACGYLEWKKRAIPEYIYRD